MIPAKALERKHRGVSPQVSVGIVRIRWQKSGVRLHHIRSLSKDEDTLSLSIVPKSSTSDPRDKTVLFRGGSAGSALLEVAEKNSRGDDAESSREDPQSPKDSKA